MLKTILAALAVVLSVASAQAQSSLRLHHPVFDDPAFIRGSIGMAPSLPDFGAAVGDGSDATAALAAAEAGTKGQIYVPPGGYPTTFSGFLLKRYEGRGWITSTAYGAGTNFPAGQGYRHSVISSQPAHTYNADNNRYTVYGPGQDWSKTLDADSMVVTGANTMGVPIAAASISSLTQTGNVATATTSAPHGYVVGSVVVISGASPSAYDVTAQVLSVPTTTTFTFAVAGSPTSPATGTIAATPTYVYTPETDARHLIYDYASGWNGLAGNQNGGRSGASADRIGLFMGGQGDLVGRYDDCNLYGAQTGTHFIANGACVLGGGGLAFSPSGAHGLLQDREVHFDDGGTLGSAVALTYSFNRNNNSSPTAGEVWGGIRLQTTGAYPVDFGYTLAGKFNSAFDTSPATLTNQAAFVMAPNQRVYYGATAPVDTAGIRWFGGQTGPSVLGGTLGTTYSSFDNTTLTFEVNNNPTLQIKVGGIVVSGNINVPAGSGIVSPGWFGTLATPASSSATCVTGQFEDDANYHYVCTATNHWRRVALADF